jgi:hypothetical protein
LDLIIGNVWHCPDRQIGKGINPKPNPNGYKNENNELVANTPLNDAV